MYGAAAVANDDDRSATERAADIVAGRADFGLVCQEHPGAIEDALDLELVNVVIDEDVAAHQAALYVNPTLFRCRHDEPT